MKERSIAPGLCSGCSGKAILTLLLALLLASCDDDVKNRFQGYAEGEYVYVATSVAGRLDKLSVSRGQAVEANAPLFELEHENETAEVQQAKAQLGDLETGKRKPELDVLRDQLKQAITAEHLSVLAVPEVVRLTPANFCNILFNNYNMVAREGFEPPTKGL